MIRMSRIKKMLYSLVLSLAFQPTSSHAILADCTPMTGYYECDCTTERDLLCGSLIISNTDGKLGIEIEKTKLNLDANNFIWLGQTETKNPAENLKEAVDSNVTDASCPLFSSGIQITNTESKYASMVKIAEISRNATLTLNEDGKSLTIQEFSKGSVVTFPGTLVMASKTVEGMEKELSRHNFSATRTCRKISE